ncbi:MAG: hypothetical protein GXP45_02350 [bacterium]|nr:hypothetical protein [bacterium]
MNLDDLSQNPSNNNSSPQSQTQNSPKVMPQDPIPSDSQEIASTQATANTQQIPNASVATPPPAVATSNQPQINVNVEGSKEHIIIEKPDTKCKNTNGFFRIITLIVLIITGFLMLGESSNILSLNFGGWQINTLYSIIVLLSVLVLFVYKKILGKIL